MKALPSPDAGATRRAHLREYLLSCLRDKVITWSDLRSPIAAVEKIVQLVREDGRKVVEDLGRDGGANSLRLAAGFIGQKLMDLADELQGGTGKGKG